MINTQNSAKMDNKSGNETMENNISTNVKSEDLNYEACRTGLVEEDINYKAHRKGISREDMSDCYTDWANRSKYDEDLRPGIYDGPAIAAAEVSECYPNQRGTVRIIDVACGTGRVGKHLAAQGFKCIDGIDPSSGMLAVCRDSNVYGNLYEEFVDERRLPIDDSSYDCLVISGGMGEGHIPCNGLYEMIRIVKPGGLIIIVMYREYLDYVEEYVDRLEPLMNKLVEDNKWEYLERREVDNYAFNKTGVLFKFRVK